MPLTITATLGKAFVPRLRKYLKKAIPLVPNAPEEISLALVNDKLMSELHQRHLNIPGPTDVLTYELDHDTTGWCIAGEIVVCVPEAKRQAKERGTTVDNELLLYALHGVLHLAGFDDRTERLFREIHTMEDDILTRIGVGPVFKPAAKATARVTGRRRNRTRARAD
ncbi:MAG TPA: rRNA maturation RNase YbeY [Tepidisphaeraceae bacterium]|jgi:probable rRNA maturation factor|nr:rRNA maturation RNase YbeY [Tepidisphaeraceae bacterium]